MPPEPSPWDRKDVLRERKYEGAVAPATGKWKDSYSKSGDVTPLRLSRSDDAPRVSGFGKQGNYRLFSEESSYGSTPRPATDPRSHDRVIEDENCRPSSSHRLDSKIGRSSRDLKGVDTASSKSGQREWKGYQSDNADGYFPSSVNRHEEPVRYMSYHHHSHSGSENSWDRNHIEKQNDKMGIDGFHGRYSERSMDIRIDRLTGSQGSYSHESSLGSIRWKPLKWTRPSSVSSWGSVIPQSAGSKSVRSEDGNESELARKTTPSRSPSGDASAGAATSISGVYSHAMKKQRLGWGQGLAKYEKEKVEGHEDTCPKSDLGVQSTGLKSINSPLPILQDEISTVTVKQGCASPTATSLASCSLPSGEKEKDSCYVGDVPSGGSFDEGACAGAEDFTGNFDKLDINSIETLISDVMHSEDSISDHPTSKGSASLDKLASLKKVIMKVLEKKEYEIDLSENELRSLCTEIVSMDDCRSAANSCGSVTNGFSKQTNKSQETSPGLNLVGDPSQSHLSILVPTSLNCAESVPCDVQCEKTSELENARQTCEPHLIGLSSSTDVDLVNCTHDEKPPVKPSINIEILSGEETISCATQDMIGRGTYACADLTKLGEMETTLTTSVLAANKELAREASEELLRFLPVDIHKSNSVLPESSRRALGTEMHESTGASIRRNLAKKKCYLRFKERSLTLKYRAFYYLWKEDLRLLSIRKYRSKQQKRLEPSSRSFHNGFQKHRSSIRSRFTSPGGNLTLVPTTEVVAFTGKLLSDSLMKVCRNNLKMPAMILDEKERHSLKFVSWNGLVEDPCGVEKERPMINPWTTEETEVFIEALNAFGKNFSKIASVLKHKTTADCVEFYYKNHKSEKFDRVKKLMGKTKEGKGASANTYLLTTGKKWDHEKDAASLDILGAASVAAAHSYENQRAGLMCADRLPEDGYYGCKMSEMDDGVLERTGDLDMLGNERDARAGAGDLMFGICGALSSEAVSSCVTSSVGPGDGSNDWKYQKMESGFDTPLTPEVMQSVDEDTCSEESYGEVAFSDWTDAEKAIFITALRSYGKDFATISRCVGSRSRDQCKIFFSKARKCLGLDVIHVGLGNEGTPLSDARGGRSDTEDACAGEMDSAFCNTQSCSKLETEGSPVGFGGSMVSSSNEGYGYSASNSVQVKKIVAANREERITQLSLEPQVKNEDNHLSVSLIHESAVLKCDVGREKLEVTTPKVEQDVGGLTADVASDCNEGTVPGIKVEVGPDTQMHDSQLPESCGNCEAVNHQTDVAVEPKQKDGIDSDAHVNGPLNVLNDQSVSGSVMRFCSSKQLIGDLASEEQNSTTAMVIPRAKDSNHGTTVSPRTEIDNDNNGLFSCNLDVNNSPHSRGGKSSPPGTSSAAGYDPRVTDGPLVPTSEVLGCGKKSQLIPWQQEGCLAGMSNSDQAVARENLKDASSSNHYEGNIVQVGQLSQAQESGNRMQIDEPMKAMCSFTVSNFYRGCQSSNKADQPLQNNCTSYSLQSLNKEDVGVGSASSVSEKQALLRGLGSLKKLHDPLKSNSTLQNQFFIQENGSGHHNYNNHIEYSLFLPKNMDNLDGATEKVSSEGASMFDASYGVKQHISKKCSTLPGNEGESSKPGEVKLFGQNLVVHQPANKPVTAQTESRVPQKLHPLQERNGNAVGINLAENKGSDDIPRCTYGFWDANRTPTGLSSLTDSGLLISSGPRVTDSRGALEQRTLSSVKVDDRMFYASREAIGASGLTNYHIYSNEVVQPFTVEVTRPLSVVPDIQKRSIMLEKMQQPLLGLQHQARGVGGVNVVNCLTDPVVALKMQYAENFCMQNGVREDDKWRGDINR
ncbi:Nuclear receptor corepressor 1 [Nymphaea thermarum]|nr:Nuclear receptor corepressor 1 [Nymphaea thermarum]